MRSLGWLLTGLAALAVLVVAGVWLAPSLLDWNRYRAGIAELASERVGLPVAIDGPISLTLLPRPTLTAERVSLEGGGGKARARQLRLEVALGPLLAGRIEARDLVLRGLDLSLPWTPSAGPGLLARAAPDWLSRLSARIEDGRLTIGGLVLSNIDASLTTSDATGSYRLVGTARLGAATGAKRDEAADWHFAARLSRPGGDGAVGLELAVDGLGPLVGLGGSLTAQVRGDGTMAGRIALRGPDLSRLLPAPAVAFRAQGRVSVAGGLAVADQLSGELGGAAASGAVALRLEPRPRLDVALSASRLDLDGWAPALLAAGRGPPDLLPIGIDLSAEAATLGGGTLRRLRGAFDIEHGAVLVREARAVLPGDAALRLTGRLAGARFTGEASLTAPALRTTMAWGAVGVGDGGLPPGALRTAQLSGAVEADTGGVRIERLTGVLDGGPVKGALTLRLGRVRTIAADLSLDRLDLAPVLGDPPPSAATLLARLAEVAPWSDRLGPGLRLDIRLHAQQALLHGVTLVPFTLDLAAEPGRLVLRDAQFALDGLRARLSGTLLDGGRLADGKATLAADHADALAALLPGLAADDASGLLAGLLRAPIWLEPIALEAEASGTARALALNLAGSLGDLRIEARPVLDLTGPHPRWQGAIALRHPGAPRLAVSLGLADAPAWLGDGSLSLVAQLSAGGDTLGLGDFTLTAGGLRATGGLSLKLDTPGGPSLTGRINADQLPLPRPGWGQPLPLGALAGWQGSVAITAGQVLVGPSVLLRSARGTLALSGGTLRLEGLTARLGGGALTMRASLDASAATPLLALQASLTGAELGGPLLDQPFDLTAGTLDAKATLASHGFSPEALLAGMAGSLDLTVRGGALNGLDLAGVVTALTGGPDDSGLRRALTGGSMGFDTLEVAASLSQGVVRLNHARLAAPAGGIDVSGDVSLPQGRLDLQLALRPKLADDPAVAPPRLGLRISGSPAAPQRAPELADLIRWRAERDQERAAAPRTSSPPAAPGDGR